MEILKIEIGKFIPEEGIEYKWEHGFDIETHCNNTSITISANKEGLVSLARHLLTLAQDSVPSGHHLHFDEYNSLEEGSVELTIEKK